MGIKERRPMSGIMDVDAYRNYQRFQSQTMEEFLATETRVKELETAIRTADPIELGRIKTELEKEL